MPELAGKYDFELNLQDSLRHAFLSKIAPESTVLEFGPATGFVTRYLRDTLKCKVYIVELDAAAFAKSREFAEDGLCGNLETLQWEQNFAGVLFDYILFADVLEHLQDPKRALERAQTLLKDDGRFIISIPNIAYGGVPFALMNNTFPYTKHGILDDTHLRFYTEDSFAELLSEAGLSTVTVEGFDKEVVESEFSHAKQNHPHNLVQYILGKRWANIYQYLFVAAKASAGIKPARLADKHAEYVPVHIYYDLGNGFSEENKLYTACATGNGELPFELPVGAVKQLRFDIMTGCGLMCSDVYICSCGKPPVYPASSNAISMQEGMGYYVAEAAQILFDLEGQPLETADLVLHYHIQADYGVGAQSPVLHTLVDMDQQLKNQLAASQKETYITAQELCASRQEVANKEQELFARRQEIEKRGQELCASQEAVALAHAQLEQQQGQLVQQQEQIGRQEEEIRRQEGQIERKNEKILCLKANLFQQNREIVLQDNEITAQAHKIEVLNEEASRAQEQLRQYESALAEIRASASWKITKPLRSVSAVLRSFGNK